MKELEELAHSKKDIITRWEKNKKIIESSCTNDGEGICSKINDVTEYKKLTVEIFREWVEKAEKGYYDR